MNKEKLMDALGHLEEDLLLEADEQRQKRGQKIVWLRFRALAACMVLLLMVVAMVRAGDNVAREPDQPGITVQGDDLTGSPVPPPGAPADIAYSGAGSSSHWNTTPYIGAVADDPDDHPGNAESDGIPFDELEFALGQLGGASADCPGNAEPDGIYVNELEIALGRQGGIAADMMAFFIYGGRSYVEYCWIPDSAGTLLGDYVATATGLINEWTEEDGYVELAGSVSGDFYTVNGYDPTFMLCMKLQQEGEQTLQIFVQNNGITLNQGSDLYTDRLKLTAGYDHVQYETRNSWNYSLGQLKTLPESARQTMGTFLWALKAGTFQYTMDIPLEEGERNVYDDKEIYHMYIHKDDGMVIHLRLFAGGYVSFDGIWSVCVQVEQEIFDELIQILQEG